MRTLKCSEEVAPVGQPIADEDAGFGVLKTERGCLPLVAMDVRARLSGLIADTVVRQTFRNSLDEPLEATYVFPLPDRAAVTSFRMKIADRIVEGELKERAQAREDYEKAIEAGHRAAIAEEERSGTFSLRVGNIPAKEEVSVELTLVGPVPVADGEATFRFPLVVAPRYVAGIPLDGPPVGSGWGQDTDEVPDASRVTPPVLLPGFPNPVRLSLEVELDPAGLCPATPDWASTIRSSLHSVILNEGPPWTIRLQPDERLNRDFILRFPVANSGIQTTLLCGPVAKGQPGAFALTIVPPSIDDKARPAPRDVVVVLDRSGSMGGWKMIAGRRAVGRMIDTLLEQDRFTVLAFDDSIEYPDHADGKLVEASDRNRWRAMEWLGKIDARGGTEMGPALQHAVKHLVSSDAARQRIVVLVTDGEVAGEDAILRSLKKAAGPSIPRIHTVGIDQAVNEGFLQRLAKFGGGTCDLVESEDRLDEAMDHIHHAIGTPALSQIRLEPVGFELVADSLAPSRLPDLFADRPVTVFGRFTGDLSAIRVRVHAVDAAGHPWRQEVDVCPRPATALASLWGRARVRELEDRYAAGDVSDPQALAKQIVQVSITSHVLSRFTAYVAVDRSEVVNRGGKQHQITQPVEMPAGWDMASDMLAVRSGVGVACYSPVVLSRSAVPQSFRLGLAKAMTRILRVSEDPGECLAPPTRTIQAIVDDLQKVLAKTQRFGRMKPPTRVKHLAHLVELLAELAAVLQQEKHPAAPTVEELARRGQEIVDAAAGGQDALDTTRTQDYFAAIASALDSVSGQSGPAPQRKSFWT